MSIFPISRIYQKNESSVGLDMGSKNDGSWVVFMLGDSGVFIDHAAMDADVVLSAEHTRQLSDRLARWAKMLDDKAKPKAKKRRAKK
jgi:hypothetical protein